MYALSYIFQAALFWVSVEGLGLPPASRAFVAARSRGLALRAFNFPWNAPASSSAAAFAAAQESKGALVSLCNSAPTNGVGASDEAKAAIEVAAKALEKLCPPKPARRELRGIYDLLYDSLTQRSGSY
jgi:hypothetical protein